MRFPLLLVLGAMLAGCSSAARTGTADKCTEQPADSVYMRISPAYRCGLTKQAEAIRPRPQLNYSPSRNYRPPACSSVELEFVISAMGIVEPETVRIVKSNNTELSEAVLSTVRAWRYIPAEKGGEKVRQIAREQVAMVTQVVVVPAGSTPTRGTSAPPRVPTSC